MFGSESDVTGKVLAGYLRLTVDRHGNKIGIESQKKNIEEWAARNGSVIGEWYIDRDVTAAERKVKRQGYERMLEDIELGRWEGIAVWRLDRLVRLTREFERCFGIVEDASGFIVSTSDGLNTLTTLGAMVIRIMVLIAEMEIDGMKTRNRAYQRERARDGQYSGGGPRPFGFAGAIKEDLEDGGVRYLNIGEVGVAHVESEAEAIRWAARKILDDGWTWIDVCRHWNATDTRVATVSGKPWSPFTLQRVMTGLRIVGMREAEFENPDGGGPPIVKPVPAVWQAILDLDTWEKLKKTLQPTGKRGRHHSYLLSGMVACGRCGRPLTGSRRIYRKNGEQATTLTYRCKSTPQDHAKGSCGKLSVLADDVERLVVTRVLYMIAEHPGLFEGLTEDDGGPEPRLAELWEELAECDDKLADLARDRARRGGITKSEWEVSRAQILADQADIKREIDSISRRRGVPVPETGDFSALVRWFEGDLTLEQRRKLLGLCIGSLSIAPPGRSGRYFKPDRVVLELAEPE